MIVAILTVVVVLYVIPEKTSVLPLIFCILFSFAAAILFIFERKSRRFLRRDGIDKQVKTTKEKSKAPQARVAPTGPKAEPVKEREALVPQGLRLLEKMLNGNHVEINPVVDLMSKTGYSYPSVNGLLGADDTQIIWTLESLAESNILEKQFSQTLFSCPKCGAFIIQLCIRCPKCDCNQLTRCRVLEHFACACVGPEETFVTEKGYFCPKCRKELRAIGVDYRSLGIHYKCQRCGGLSSAPTEEYHCLKCQVYFPKYEANEVSLYSYKLNELGKERIEAEIKPKEQLVDALSKAGYDVRSPAKVMGGSTVEHELDVYAIKDSSALGHKLAIDIAFNEKEVSAVEVLRLHAKAFDIGATDSILIAIPKIASEAIPLAIQYNVRVIEAKHLDMAVEELLSQCVYLYQLQFDW